MPLLEENYQRQVELVSQLNKVEKISAHGGSEKAHTLHLSRNKVLGRIHLG